MNNVTYKHTGKPIAKVVSKEITEDGISLSLQLTPKGRRYIKKLLRKGKKENKQLNNFLRKMKRRSRVRKILGGNYFRPDALRDIDEWSKWTG